MGKRFVFVRFPIIEWTTDTGRELQHDPLGTRAMFEKIQDRGLPDGVDLAIIVDPDQLIGTGGEIFEPGVAASDDDHIFWKYSSLFTWTWDGFRIVPKATKGEAYGEPILIPARYYSELDLTVTPNVDRGPNAFWRCWARQHRQCTIEGHGHPVPFSPWPPDDIGFREEDIAVFELKEFIRP